MYLYNMRLNFSWIARINNIGRESNTRYYSLIVHLVWEDAPGEYREYLIYPYYYRKVLFFSKIKSLKLCFSQHKKLSL